MRAVLSADEARCLLNGHSANDVGQEFPTKGQEPGVEFALLRILEGEMNEKWRTGFYRFDDLTRMEEAVQACTAELAGVAGKESGEPGPLWCGPLGV